MIYTVDSRYSTIRYSTISVIVGFSLVPQMSVAIVRFTLVTHFFIKNVNLVRYLEFLLGTVYDYIILYSDLYRNDSTICSCHPFFHKKCEFSTIFRILIEYLIRLYHIFHTFQTKNLHCFYKVTR